MSTGNANIECISIPLNKYCQPCIQVYYLHQHYYSFFLFISDHAEPNHERALSNLAYFKDVQASDPDKFVDAEITPPPSGTDRLQPSEKEAYEALCREAKPLVSY